MKTFRDKINAVKYILGPKYKKSYSQCGEDLVVGRILKNLGIAKPFYVDIGANDPVIYSNTYGFYKDGANGICIEPNPSLCEKIKAKRPRDIVLGMGIGEKEGSLPYFMFANHSLNTFSPKEAAGAEKKGFKMTKKIDVLSIDVEGWDLEILKSIDFTKIRPAIICTETKKYEENISETETPTGSFLKGKGYLLVYNLVNSIFVDPLLWKK